jgi:predicted GNAT family N-acyltransferase
VLEEQRFNTALHDCATFDCGVLSLDEYLAKFASQRRRRGISQTYVLVDSESLRAVLGYYSLSAAQIDAGQISETDQKRLPRYPIPCFRIGRLACQKNQQGKGIGRLLIGSAVARCLKAREEVASDALIVDAKDERVKAFYEHYGFTSCADPPNTLCLPLGK